MSFENSTVDNYILASILEVSNFSNVKLTEKIIFKNKHQYFFMPSNMINDNFNHYPLDTYGILNKSKLLMREPITGDQISYITNNAEFNFTNGTNGLVIETKISKIFYFYEIKNIPHKYTNSIFTNLKSKNINIVFPSSDTIHVISDNINNLKKYVKKLSNNVVDIKSIVELKIPKEMTINENNKIINNISILNDTFLGMTYQLTQILKILSKSIKSPIKASESNSNYINKLFFTFYNFIPNFLSSFIFKFLLRLNKAYNFSNQVLEIDNFYNFESYFFSNSIDEEYLTNGYIKGKFLPKIKLLDENRDLKDILSNENTIICSSDVSLKSTSDVIYLKVSSNKNKDGYNISQSTFELLNLDERYYVVSQSGLIMMIDLNKNLNDKSNASSLVSQYTDKKQISLDSFNTKNFKPSLPKLPKPRISFNWPFRTKKQ
jgi:hypothetical protein